MTTTISKENDRIIIVLDGELDTAASLQVERDLAPAFAYDDCDFLVDCDRLTYISSSGLRLILSLYKHTRRNGHNTILKNVKESVEDVFRISGFMQLFKIEQ